MSKILFESINDARDFYRTKTSQAYNNFLQRRGFDVQTTHDDDILTLREKLNKINILLNDDEFLKSKTHEFTSKNDFSLKESNSNTITIRYTILHFLTAAKDYIQEKINQLEQSTSVKSIKELVDELPENEIKNNLKTEIEELEVKKKELLIIRDEERNRLNDEIEIGRHKAEIFAKRSDIFLKFLDRESIASIIGSILLLLMGICLLIMMFRQEEPIKIVESAFLLILGYFFGHSKNNK